MKNEITSQIKKFHEDLNKHRKRLRRFNPEQLVILICQHFRDVGLNKQRACDFPHNELYYLLKQTIKCAEKPYTPYNTPKQEDFIKLIETQKQLVGPQFDIAQNENDPVVMSLKLFTFCQLPYQEQLDKTAIGRSIFLFEVEDSSKSLDEMFFDVTGLQVRDFFIGCFTLFAISQNCLFIERYLIKPEPIVFEKDKWVKLWPLVCKTFSGFCQACKKYDLRSDLYEMYSAPIIERYPIVELPSGKNIIPWPQFILNRLCYGPYDILKDVLGNEFTGLFGIVFQNYIERLLNILRDKTDQTFLSDRDYGKSEKQPDFVLPSSVYDTLMCIEAKGNEDSLILDKEKLADIVQPVIGKAVCQCHDLWVRTQQDQVESIKENHKNCTPLVVTFKSFDFANSKFYRQEVVGPMRNERCQESFSHCVNRYQVLDIRSFERLISIAICSCVSLHEILEKKNTQGLEDDWCGFLAEQYKNLEDKTAYSHALEGISKEFEKLYQELTDKCKN